MAEATAVSQPTQTEPNESQPSENSQTGESQTEQGQEQTTDQKEPERFTRQQKVIHRQQQELKKQREEFEAARQQHEQTLAAQRQELDQLKAWKQELDNGNPWRFLKDNNYDLHQLSQMALANDQDPKAVAMAVGQELEKKIRAEYDQKFQEFQRQQDDKEQAQFEAQLSHKRSATEQEIAQYIQGNRERFELTSVYPQAEAACLQVIWEQYQASEGQVILTYEQAADMVERYLEQEELQNNPLFKTGKAKNFLFPQDDSVLKAKKSSASPSERRKPSARASLSHNEPRTLQNRMSSVSTPKPQNETFEERKARLSRELATGTWKPKPEYMR